MTIQTSQQVKAVIYARVSTKEQADRGLSIRSQLEDCNRHAINKGWTVVDEYIDAGRTGTNTYQREAFTKMLEDGLSDQPPFSVIITARVDRFGRSDLDPHFKALLLNNGVAVRSLDLPEGADDTQLLMLEGMNELTARLYPLFLKKQVRRGQQEAVKAGKFGTGLNYPAFGYRIETTVEANGRVKRSLDVNAQTAPLLREIFERYANGASIRGITKWLNQTIKSPAALAGRKARGITHGIWIGGTVLRILRNECYLGRIVYGRRTKKKTLRGKKEVRTSRDAWTTYDNAHPALISEDLFQRVQARLLTQSQVKARADHPLNFLGSVGRCASCGATAALERNGTSWYYYCRSWRRFKLGTESCRRAIRHETVLAQVSRFAAAILRPPTYETEPTLTSPPVLATGSEYASLIVITFDEVGKFVKPPANAIEFAVERYNQAISDAPDFTLLPLKNELCTVTKQRDRLVDAIANGVDAISVHERLESVEVQILQINSQIEQIRTEMKPRFELLDPKAVAKNARDLNEAFLANNGAGIREIIPAIFNQITINFAYNERDERLKAKRKKVNFDGFGSVTLRSRFDLENIQSAPTDSLKLLALAAAGKRHVQSDKPSVWQEISQVLRLPSAGPN